MFNITKLIKFFLKNLNFNRKPFEKKKNIEKKHEFEKLIKQSCNSDF